MWAASDVAFAEASLPTQLHAPSGSRSLSIGLPWGGALQRAVRLERSATIRYLPKFIPGDNFWGTAEMVSMLRRSARTVAKRWAGSRLTVGELSAREGGYLPGHHSHRNGRDADIAFFMRDARDRFIRFPRFVPFHREPRPSAGAAQLRFDDARNWALVEAILNDPDARVQYMFVAKPIRKRLLMEGRRRGASAELLRSAAAVMVEPKRGHKHGDHFHVRIFCAPDDRPECADPTPYWPWYDGNPPTGEHHDLPVIRWRTASR